MKKLVLLLGVVLAMGFASCEKSDPNVAQCYQINATFKVAGTPMDKSEQMWTNEIGAKEATQNLKKYADALAATGKPVTDVNINYKAITNPREQCGEAPAANAKCYKTVVLIDRAPVSIVYMYDSAEKVDEALNIAKGIAEVMAEAQGKSVTVEVRKEETSVTDQFACEDQNPLPTE